MANDNRHGNKKATKRTPYTGFEKSQKRDAKGHFIKNDNAKKKANRPDGYNCYISHKPERSSHADEISKVKDDFSIVRAVVNDIVNQVNAAKLAYEKKPVYSESDMDYAIVRTRNEVRDSLRKHFKTAFWNGVASGVAAGGAITGVVLILWPSIVSFAKSLFS